jgi:ring-1,2-phenylacetyl-CoA epoxidase subunit PaaD
MDQVWDALGRVPDPEVPAISIVELGIVRDVSVTDGRVRIEVTPTYSGCPATEMISTMIREELASVGLDDVDLVTTLSPPWTTDWIAPEGKRKLAQYGIAPPHKVVKFVGVPVSRMRKSAVACPRCGSKATSLISQFGSTACKAQYRCDACREPFDYFKPH